MKKIFLLSAISLLSIQIFAQKTVALEIKHFLGNNPFVLQQTATNNLNNNFNVGRMEYYISRISLIHDGGKETSFKGVYILANASSKTLVTLGNADFTNAEGIRFYIGVGMPENFEDPSLYSADHPLAFKTPSMHWGWTAGYRFVAMEGKTGSTMNTLYELHALGNQNYFGQTITTKPVLENNQYVFKIKADYVEALKNIKVSTGIVVHGTAGAAITILQNFRDYVFSPLTTTGNKDLSNENEMTFFPNPNKGLVQIKSNTTLPTFSHIMVSDVSGRLVSKIPFSDVQNNSFRINEKGLMLISVMQEDKTLFSTKLLVE